MPDVAHIEKIQAAAANAERELNKLYGEDAEGVNHPSHYNRPGLQEAIDIIWALGWGPGFNLGNAFKYLYRQDVKEGESTRKDIGKAHWYLGDYLKRTKEEA